MDKDKIIHILKSALETIAFEAMEPIIKVYAQSALDATNVKFEKSEIIYNNHCALHKWYGLATERCPICAKQITG